MRESELLSEKLDLGDIRGGSFSVNSRCFVPAGGKKMNRGSFKPAGPKRVRPWQKMGFGSKKEYMEMKQRMKRLYEVV